MSASNHRRPTSEIVNAIVAVVTALKLADTVTPAFNRIELFDSEDLVAAFQFLLITEQRVCVVVPLTEEFDNVFSGLKLTVKRRLPLAILCSDKVLGSRKEALWGLPAEDPIAPDSFELGGNGNFVATWTGLEVGARYLWTPGANEIGYEGGPATLDALNGAAVFTAESADAQASSAPVGVFTGSLVPVGASTPGAMALAELVLPLVAGPLLANPKGLVCEPQRITILTVKDTEKQLPSRVTVALEVECRGGWLEATLPKGHVL